MKPLMIFALFTGWAASGFGADLTRGEPGFRVRSDFAAELNADRGWAGGLNQNVTIQADLPFRIRFEVEPTNAAPAKPPFSLQYRRNQGEWNGIEAHDFPHPEAEVDLNFRRAKLGTPPTMFQVVQGNRANLAVIKEQSQNILQAGADQKPLIGLYRAPWDLPEFEFSTRLRLPAENRTGAGLIFGFQDADNYFRVSLDGGVGAVRVIRTAQGSETVLTEKKTDIPAGRWLELELDFEGRELEVNFDEGTLEWETEVGKIDPTAPVGFSIPPNGSADFGEFSLTGQAKTPRVSVVSCRAFENGGATTDLLKGSSAGFQPGFGISLSGRSPAWMGRESHGEFEWPLVVRRFAEGPVTNEEGDTFEFRMVDADGKPVGPEQNPVLRLSIPPGHVGGTFVETPGRIGPWQAKNGDLYFIMEPAETDNDFMMIKSTDNGRTWKEVDGVHRPKTGDLESVDARLVGDTIHIIHQVTRSTRYHAFRTSDHPTRPDTWAVRDEQAGSVNAIAQAASLVVRSDGSLVAFYVGQTTIHYNIRSSAGKWGAEQPIDPEIEPNLAGPQAVLGKEDTVHLAYYGTDGTIWYRRLLPDGTLTDRQRLASGAGTTRAEYGAVLPLLFIPESNTAVIIYRLESGALWERRIIDDGPPTPAVQVTDRKVVRDAVDSQQPGADAVLDGGTVHVLFIEQSSRNLFSTHDKNGWQPSKLQVDDIQGSWVRGNIYTRPDGVRVYGFIYDAGSDGGAGMNRFGEIVLSRGEN